MTKSPSRKLPEVFVLITPKVIQIHWHSGEWELIVSMERNEPEDTYFNNHPIHPPSLSDPNSLRRVRSIVVRRPRIRVKILKF